MPIQELGHIVLYVTSLDQSMRFYRDTLGFPVVGEMPGGVAFSGGRTHHEMLLIEIGGKPPQRTHPVPGLYHIGFKVGETKEELVVLTKKLQGAGVRIIGATDHTVTHSLYILDPDGNELELYIDVTDTWKQNPESILASPKRLPYIEELLHSS